LSDAFAHLSMRSDDANEMMFMQDCKVAWLLNLIIPKNQKEGFETAPKDSTSTATNS
jgi:hypothetical protein